MTYTCDESLTNFEFWSGARDRAAALTYDQLNQLDDLLPDVMGMGRNRQHPQRYRDQRSVLV